MIGIIMELDIGEVYLVSSQRKGTFMMRIESQDEVWTRGVIVGGEIDAKLTDNKRGIGDEVGCRTSLITKATKQPKAA